MSHETQADDRKNASGAFAPSDGQDDKEKTEQEWEEREVHEKSAASATTVYKAILKEAEEELERHSRALAWSGLAAGMSMGFSLVMQGLIKTHLPEAAWARLVTNLGYPIGFVILILGRQQLFTENTLTPILAVLHHKTARNLGNTARLWGIVLLTNLLGGVLVAYALQRTSAFSEHERESFLRIASEAMEPSKATLFVKGIFAGWLVATMVWMLPVAETGRIWVLILIPYIMGLGSLSHIIVGSIDAFYSIAAHQHTWYEYIAHYFWPVLLGNCIGGVALVAVVNYGQAMAGEPD